MITSKIKLTAINKNCTLAPGRRTRRIDRSRAVQKVWSTTEFGSQGRRTCGWPDRKRPRQVILRVGL